ncbi:acetate kinase [Luteimonas kalidii]|uniref:Acetate kinase n=1 Tax=Luteimonas kalidii TaxID=3042025 RepID=A0ABT6JP33_9GAMM|nr:acetate kinase [Luteimonas kalidii]MDH5832447.1 acetate kinase [Luteimonas kalidii]
MHAQEAPHEARLQHLEGRLAEQHRQIGALQALVERQQRELDALARELGDSRLDAMRARGDDPAHPLLPLAIGQSTVGLAADGTTHPSQTAPVAASVEDAPDVQADGPRADDAAGMTQVGRPPESAERPPEVAQIFDQPGVLTPRGRLVLEPSLQFGYSSNDRVALVGYTVIPAILIGLIDVRQVKTTSLTATLAARYGLSRRLELEVRAPFSYISSDTVSREIFTGAAQDNVFQADGKGVGDLELTARYQLNEGGVDRPFYVLWLRYKTRTGRDLFEVVTDCVTRCVANATGTGLPLDLPTGSGFTALQPGVTWLYASDPVVFFGSLSYLHNFERDDVSRIVLSGAPEGFPQTTTEPIGTVDAGDIIGFNFGMGLALNERASVSFGYDQSIVDRTKQNGEDAPGAVRVVLGTLVVGGSYRLGERTSLNVALGVGVTRDTPDVSLAVRVPVTF